MQSATKARLGISLFFFSNGALYANLLPRLPEIKTIFGLDNATFGFVLAAFAAGSVSTAQLPAVLMRRLGALRQSLLATLVLAMALASLTAVRSVWWFAALLFLAGISDAIIDPAQNVHGLKVQQIYGRSIINSLHALWSAGATFGALMGTVAARVGLALGTHLIIASFSIAALAVLAACLAKLPADQSTVTPATGDRAVATALSGPTWLLVAGLVVIASCGVHVEEVGGSWTPLFLVQVSNLAESVAGIGYVVLIAAQLLGRFSGDLLTDRWGRVRMAQIGAILIGLGFAISIVFPTPMVAVIGFGIAGFGCATIVPAAFAAADEIPMLKPGTGVTIIGWLMRLGFLATSPLIGLVSAQVGLRWAFLLPVAAGLLVVLLSPVLRQHRSSQQFSRPSGTEQQHSA